MTTLERIKANRRVELVDDERSSGGYVIVTLHYGWRLNSPGEHVYGEDNPTAALRTLRRIQPCACGECARSRA